MRRQLFIIATSLAIVAGVLFTLANIRGSWIHQHLAKIIIQSCEKALDCRLHAQLRSIGLFNNQVILTHLHATPVNNDNSWGWTCKKLTFSFSLWQLISKRLFAFAIDCREFNVHTTYDNGVFGIKPHLNALAREPDFPLEMALTACSVKPIGITIVDTHGNSICAKAHIAVAQTDTQVKIRSHLLACTADTPEHGLLHNTTGSIEAVLNKKTIEKNIAAHIQTTCEPTDGITEHITCTALCKDDTASISVKNQDGSLAIHECALRFTPDHHIHASLTISKDATDICHITASTDCSHNHQVSAKLLTAQEFYGNTLKTCNIDTTFAQGMLRSSLHGDIIFSNGTDVPVDITLSPSDNSHVIEGLLGPLKLSGIIKSNLDNTAAELSLYSAHQNLLGFCSLNVEQKNSSCRAQLNSPGIQLILSQLDHNIQADGTIDLHATLEKNMLFFQASFNGMARLGALHNWLKKISLQGSFNRENKTCYVDTLTGELYRGSFHIADARCVLNQQYELTYVYAPITLSECLLNIRKDLFTMISSALIFSYQKDEQPHVSGTVFFDKTMIKENLFAAQFIQSLFPQSMTTQQSLSIDPTFSIALQTKDAIHVKTPLLELAAHMRLSLLGCASRPELQGRVLLQSGSLSFPYAQLLLSKGKIEFAKGRIADPIIELHANNTIKKHKITLQVTGSLKYPHILLDSYPSLTQEQILCLLLAGSPDSLSGVAPAALLQSMKYLVLDAEHAPSKLHAAIRHLFAPFKHIYLIPSFSDQTSRGGLRGAIEIDIADRWRALIQKNFSLTEDTRLEIEYAITDDMWFRAFRDERHDVGAELEFRWKF